jgi:hypothetical protein
VNTVREVTPPPFRTATPGKPALDTEAEVTLTDVADEAVGALHAFMEYVNSFLKLQGFRLEEELRSVLVRVGMFLIAGLVALSGFILLSAGLVDWLSILTSSRAAGFAIVGAGYLILGVIVALVARSRA